MEITVAPRIKTESYEFEKVAAGRWRYRYLFGPESDSWALVTPGEMVWELLNGIIQDYLKEVNRPS